MKPEAIKCIFALGILSMFYSGTNILIFSDYLIGNKKAYASVVHMFTLSIILLVTATIINYKFNKTNNINPSSAAAFIGITSWLCSIFILIIAIASFGFSATVFIINKVGFSIGFIFECLSLFLLYMETYAETHQEKKTDILSDEDKMADKNVELIDLKKIDL